MLLNRATRGTHADAQRLALVVKHVRTSGYKLLLVHVIDPEIGGVVEFDFFFQNAPRELISEGLFKTKAVPWYAEDAYRAISVNEAAQQLHARPLMVKRSMWSKLLAFSRRM